MTTWVISDTHFGHDKIRLPEYANRPFNSTDEMDMAMIKNWNNTVKPEDIIYHLGDVTLGSIDKFDRYINCLNGYINILPGSHDERWLDKFDPIHYPTLKILPQLWEIDSGEMNGKYHLPLVMCHYAMRVWDRSHYGSYMIYGHSHGRLPIYKNSTDMSVECWDYTPTKIEDILKRIKKQNKLLVE